MNFNKYFFDDILGFGVLISLTFLMYSVTLLRNFICYCSFQLVQCLVYVSEIGFKIM